MDEKNKLTLNGEEKKADLQKKKKKQQQLRTQIKSMRLW